jgi:cholesterol 24(S)-hydroxylase
LRIDPPVPFSTASEISETMELCGLKVLGQTKFNIMITDLHKNEEEWWEPHKFMPERFDPSSKYYLTPNGTKRNPGSYTPFLGGKRICFGKTFAENIAKSVLPVIVTQLDFEFSDPTLYKNDKTHFSSFHGDDPYNVRVKRV